MLNFIKLKIKHKLFFYFYFVIFLYFYVFIEQGCYEVKFSQTDFSFYLCENRPLTTYLFLKHS